MPELPATATMVAFAKLHGISRAAAYKWKRRGLIAYTAAGLVDVVASNARLAERPAVARGRVTKGPAAPDAPAPGNDPEAWSRTEALRQREIAQARLARIEANRESGKVADIAEVAEKVGKRFSVVRTRMLALPSALAPRLAVLNTAEECGRLLDDAIRAALTELSTIP